MRTRFWRFAYNEHQLTAILESDQLPLPDLSQWPRAKNTSPQKILEDIKVGHFILLANFDRASESGKVKVMGKVLAKGDAGITLHWKKTVPSILLNPNAQGGVAEWQTEGVFCFDVEPAKRYRLERHAEKLFANS
ncbi:hypothetical protein ACIQSO_21490 [Pseudomonas putida]|uniref:hypothetical protein n=1 Tax=Pseudomonas putida TaxID=303 RepID=UPI003839F7A4